MTLELEGRQWVASYIVGHRARSSVQFESEELAWFFTGAPSEELNGVLYVHNETAIDTALARFGDTPTLWHVWPGITPPFVEGLLVARGLRFVEEEPLMTRSMVNYRALENDRHIVEATSVAQVKEMVRIWLGNDTDEGASSVVNAVTQFPFGRDSSRHFLLYEVGGVSVACANIFVVEGVASIENVVTTVEFRNRGIGTAMTNAALNVAKRSGATHSLLTASSQGERIYRSVGFETVATVRRYG